MKYLPIRELDSLAGALNFDTNDCHVEGSCDIYTTKAASKDKKLYKDIENDLESKYESLLKFSASLSPPRAGLVSDSLNLSRSSPFGPLSQVSSRRIFAYIIATLNASHPDYDFSGQLKPSDFRQSSLRSVMETLDTTLNSLRPPQAYSKSSETAWRVPDGGEISNVTTVIWNSRMWKTLDTEMDLKDCNIFSYSSEDSLYDDEENAIWSFNYFFFNKTRKRVCYLYLRGLSPTTRAARPATPVTPRQGKGRMLVQSYNPQKRAQYWLGERAPLATTLTQGDESAFLATEIDRRSSLRPSSASLDSSPELRPQKSKLHEDDDRDHEAGVIMGGVMEL